MRPLFDEQFEPDGDDFLYRHGGKGHPVRVSAEEREQLWRNMRGKLRWLTWLGALGVFAAIVSVLWFAPAWLEGHREGATIWWIVAVFTLVFLAVFNWIWREPSRALAGRSFAGPERTAAEARNRYLRNMSWGQLIGAAVLFGVMVAAQALEHDLTHGWYRLWLVAGVAMTILVAIQAARKWRLERGRD